MRRMPVRIRMMMLALLGFAITAQAGTPNAVYSYKMKTIDGDAATLAGYKGKVLLLVNVASACGFTPQYTALEAVYEKYKAQGLVVVGIPANNFGLQEPGTDEEIQTFCR